MNAKTFETQSFDRTMVHEMWHTLSRYLPKNDLDKLRTQFAKRRKQYLIDFDTNKKKFIKETSYEDFKQYLDLSLIHI